MFFRLQKCSCQGLERSLVSVHHSPLARPSARVASWSAANSLQAQMPAYEHLNRALRAARMPCNLRQGIDLPANPFDCEASQTPIRTRKLPSSTNCKTNGACRPRNPSTPINLALLVAWKILTHFLIQNLHPICTPRLEYLRSYCPPLVVDAFELKALTLRTIPGKEINHVHLLSGAWKVP